jgi:ubiquinone/menaquinone biosynthesis C-methylase UbiE
MKTNYFKDWEELADLDPKWAVLTEASKQYGKWEDDEFFLTGKKEIENFINKASAIGVNIDGEQALDFGCGLGRLTRALSPYFDKVYGTDISQRMIDGAKSLNKDEKLVFIHNPRHDLSCFADEQLAFIYSNITLQHIPDREAIKKYILEFIRILKPGGYALFYLPSIPQYSILKEKGLKLRGKIYHLAISIGISKSFCFRHLKIKPFMKMNYITSEEIKKILPPTAEIVKIFDEKSLTTSYLVKKN